MTYLETRFHAYTYPNVIAPFLKTELNPLIFFQIIQKLIEPKNFWNGGVEIFLNWYCIKTGDSFQLTVATNQI